MLLISIEISMRLRQSHLKNVAGASHLAFRPGHYYSPICDTQELKFLAAV